MTPTAASSAAAPARVSRRAAAACDGGVNASAAAPALAAAPAAKTKGSVARASCQTGTAVLATSAAVYVLSGSPRTAAPALAAAPARGALPVHELAAAAAVSGPKALSSHEPMLIGELILNIRSMFKKRAGT